MSAKHPLSRKPNVLNGHSLCISPRSHQQLLNSTVRLWPEGDGRQDRAIISATDPKQSLCFAVQSEALSLLYLEVY